MNLKNFWVILNKKCKNKNKLMIKIYKTNN